MCWKVKVSGPCSRPPTTQLGKVASPETSASPFGYLKGAVSLVTCSTKPFWKVNDVGGVMVPLRLKASVRMARPPSMVSISLSS
ncbi:MAG: hypothetical protein P8Y05_00225 [Deinococcales bacterium]